VQTNVTVTCATEGATIQRTAQPTGSVLDN
jgi:hypothetical protein